MATPVMFQVAICRQKDYQLFKRLFESGGAMTRPAEYTRQSIIKAAVTLSRTRGLKDQACVDIVTKARVNQAAINYHFKGKDGLYFEILKIAFERMTDNAELDAEKSKPLSREEALRSFVRHQLRPLLFQDERVATYGCSPGKARIPQRSFESS